MFRLLNTTDDYENDGATKELGVISQVGDVDGWQQTPQDTWNLVISADDDADDYGDDLYLQVYLLLINTVQLYEIHAIESKAECSAPPSQLACIMMARWSNSSHIIFSAVHLYGIHEITMTLKIVIFLSRDINTYDEQSGA